MKKIFTVGVFILNALISNAQGRINTKRPLIKDVESQVGLGILVDSISMNVTNCIPSLTNADIPPKLVKIKANEFNIITQYLGPNYEIFAYGITLKNASDYIIKQYSVNNDTIVTQSIHELTPKLDVFSNAVFINNNIVLQSVPLYNYFQTNDGVAEWVVTMRERKSDKIIYRLNFLKRDSVPKPQPLAIIIDRKIIENRVKHSGLELGQNYSFYSVERSKDSILIKKENKLNSVFLKNSILPSQLKLSSENNTLAIVFNRFIIEDNHNFYTPATYLSYKIDNESDWRTTPQNVYPVLLLENMSRGNHTIQVKYNKENAEVFSYHFSIAPN